MSFDNFSLSTSSKASLVSIICNKFEYHADEVETNHSLVELRELLRTLGIETGEQYTQKRNDIVAGTILGKGRLEEIAEAAQKEGSKYLVFDFELTASQQRNIKKITKMVIIDRVSIILEIFAAHAKTKEAKIQIEISRLQHILPRLSSLWTHFTKKKGGIGLRSGEGEQQIELDRRIIRDRIEHYKKQLKEIAVSRKEQRKKRENKAITAALVGYTNAGKSSVMNRLCKVDILEEDKLFATLDSTFRMLNPDTKPPMILIDTVGFISNLPNTLINGFRTTLESAIEADLLIIVCDVSDANFEKHLKVTEDILEELNIKKKDRLIVFNKKDLVQDPLRLKVITHQYENAFVVSSFCENDMDNLREFVIEFFLKQQTHYDLFVPYNDGNAHAKITGKTNIESCNHHEDGIFYRVRIPEFIFHSLHLSKYRLAPGKEI